ARSGTNRAPASRTSGRAAPIRGRALRGSRRPTRPRPPGPRRRRAPGRCAGEGPLPSARAGASGRTLRRAGPPRPDRDREAARRGRGRARAPPPPARRRSGATRILLPDAPLADEAEGRLRTVLAALAVAMRTLALAEAELALTLDAVDAARALLAADRVAQPSQTLARGLDAEFFVRDALRAQHLLAGL